MSEPAKEVRRLPPCPAYDVEGMESWLTDLAREEGLLLVQDGIFAGVAAFEKGEPQQVKYRLEAAPKSTSFLAKDGGEPDPEAVELNRAYHWDYVGRRGNFYIYRTDDPTARELNTDPQVQALAINAARKRQAGSMFYVLFWLILYPIGYIFGNSGLLRSAVEAGTWFVLWAAALIIWAFIDSVIELVHLNRLMKKLRTDGALERNKEWRSRTVPYQVKNLLLVVLFVAWVIVALNRWAAAEERRRQPSDYQGTPPFATIADFGAADYQETFLNWNGAREWSDWLAPYNMEWSEHAQVRGEFLIAGGLRVEYHQMAAPFLARWMAWELTPRRSLGPSYAVLELPPLDADYAAAYQETTMFPTVVLQKGNQVLKATFYQTSERTLELEEWAKILTDSLNAGRS